MESRNYFTYGSVLSSDYDVYVLDAKLNNSTKREYDTVSIAGRNGDLHIDKKRYSNMSVQYSCAVVSSAGSRINEFMAALLAEDLNSKLSDSIYPEYFRKATFSGDVSPHISGDRNIATFVVKFDCAPQKWLVHGETPIAVSSGAITLLNPTLYVAKPLIKVTGTGTLKVGNHTITINKNQGYMVIDCELEDVYDSRNLSNLNNDVTLSSGEFPTLAVGETGVSVSGVSVEITPRWWTL